MQKYLHTLKRIDFGLILVISISALLRFVNLGYSDLQGDEIKALFLPDAGQNLWTFLMDQRKGPLQFLITYIIKFFDPNYENYFLMRAPFALAGVLAVAFFYLFIAKVWNKKVALYASLFFATNGFLIAFSRIIQYQSFVVLFMVVALFFFSYKKFFLGGLFWALSLLSHYDGIFILPMVFWLLKDEFKNKKLWLSAIIPTLLVLAFYVPFILSISSATLAYWGGRLDSSGGKVSSSIYLFSVYQPIYVVHFYLILSILGLIPLLYKVYKKHFEYLSLFVWTLLPLLFMEVVVDIPGTHIFTYLVPITILMGIAVYETTCVFAKLVFVRLSYLKYPMYLCMFLLYSFVLVQVYYVFVDHTTEYPWTSEKFFIFTFTEPTPVYHLSMFGFPYNRGWKEISQFVRNDMGNGFYSTNERVTISRYYVPLSKDSESAGYYLYIKNPQSFTESITNKKMSEWVSNNYPIKEISRNGQVVSKIYYVK